VKKILATPRQQAATAEPPFDPNSLLRQLKPFEATGELVEVCVANGRSVLLPSPDGAKRVTGWDVQKEQHIYGPVEESFGPGQKIQLRESEATRLMKAGLLLSRKITKRRRHQRKTKCSAGRASDMSDGTTRTVVPVS
jgi:hypothetical protein